MRDYLVFHQLFNIRNPLVYIAAPLKYQINLDYLFACKENMFQELS